ncbi:MAG TPA: hypothetical protein VLU41_08620 [Ideonella sp.]|nr:hypothetical protein [Ideonella sp.]
MGRTRRASILAAGLPPKARLPLLALGFVALVVGATAGLARLGVAMPAAAVAASGLHGPLMVGGFFGTVIALERAVAVGRGWAYLAPLAAALGVLALLIGAPWAGSVLLVASAAGLLAATLDVLRRQTALFTFTLAVGAAALLVGHALWAAGRPVVDALPWWLAFLVLTIAGERLELSRFLPPSPRAKQVFALLLAVVVAGAVAAPWNAQGFGVGLLGLAAWLLKQDIARRTVHGKGLTRFIAVCLLAGYGWLALGGALLALGATPGSLAHDAALHAITLGFVFSMVFGHAPIILPAVTRFALPYHPIFYAPLALLQASLVVRVAGDALADLDVTRAGAILNALALAAFLINTVAAVLRGRSKPRRSAAEASSSDS